MRTLADLCGRTAVVPPPLLQAGSFPPTARRRVQHLHLVVVVALLPGHGRVRGEQFLLGPLLPVDTRQLRPLVSVLSTV